MRRTLSAFAAAALLIAAAASLPACFSPEEPDCAFRCDDAVGNSNHCPDNYSCQPDGYCHKSGTSTRCPYPDASATPMPDLSRAPDMSVLPDMTGLPDMTSMPDITFLDF